MTEYDIDDDSVVLNSQFSHYRHVDIIIIIIIIINDMKFKNVPHSDWNPAT
jgi:hypothetical protein